MPAIDFANYYNDHADYIALRNSESPFFKQYLLEVDFWKNLYLGRLVEGIDVKSIVEVGCATGILLARFPMASARTRVGIDISNSNIECARLHYPQFEFYAGEAASLWSRDAVRQCFDLGILSDILEHVDDDAALLRLVADHAKYVVLNLPLEKCEENADRIYGTADRHGHLRAYDLDDARSLVQRAGLVEMKAFVRRYVQEPIFRKYLASKLFENHAGEDRLNGIARYIAEINEIDLKPGYYKSNYFALLTKHA